MDRTYVILIAQVFNGCLLPLFASCLLLCLNDREFMAASPQSGLANLPLVACVTLTFVFTANVLLQVSTDHSSHIATCHSVVYSRKYLAPCWPRCTCGWAWRGRWAWL